jgi:hypothetical protein
MHIVQKRHFNSKTCDVERNRSLLFKKLSNTTTNATKSKIWETICSKVNSANSKGYKRTVEELLPFSTQKSEAWSESACGSSVVSSARVSVPPPIPSIGVFPNIPTNESFKIQRVSNNTICHSCIFLWNIKVAMFLIDMWFPSSPLSLLTARIGRGCHEKYRH